jgi:hypothetical protein
MAPTAGIRTNNSHIHGVSFFPDLLVAGPPAPYHYTKQPFRFIVRTQWMRPALGATFCWRYIYVWHWALVMRVRWRWSFLCRIDCDCSIPLIRRCPVGFCGENRLGSYCRVPGIEPDCSMWRWSVADQHMTPSHPYNYAFAEPLC